MPESTRNYQIGLADDPSAEDFNPASALEDTLAFITLAMSSISQDEFSRCFEPNVLHPNAAPASIKTHQDIWSSLFDIVSTPMRYLVLLPIRMLVLACGTVGFVTMLPLAYACPRSRNFLFWAYANLWMFAFGGYIRYNGEKMQPDGTPSIFVSNHTSIIDYFVLSAHKFPFATVAQQHSGLMGFFQTHMLSLNGSLMFHRSNKSEKSTLVAKMKSHLADSADKNRPPLLVFPEGTCVNNEYTVLFQRGAFSMGAKVHPIAIKYSKRFGDPYWMSSRQSFVQHVLYLMSRFALVADVYYLPPETIREYEDPSEFAQRVKQSISDKAGLTCLSWDGYMKNSFSAEKRDRLKATQQHGFANSIRARLEPFQSRMSEPFHLRKRRSLKNKPSREQLVGLHFPDHLSTSQVVDIKNQLMMTGLLSTVPIKNDTLNCISKRQEHIVDTWKKFTRVKEPEDSKEKHARRVENSSWRIWFREQNNVQKTAAAFRNTNNAMQGLYADMQQELDKPNQIQTY